MAEQLFFPVAGIDARHESPRYHQFKDLESDFAHEVGYVDFGMQELVCKSFGVPVPGGEYGDYDKSDLTRERLELMILRYETAIEFLQSCRNNEFDMFLSDLDYVDVEGLGL